MRFEVFIKRFPPQPGTLLILLAVLSILFGCSANRTQLAERASQLESFEQEEGNLFAEYMAGNPERARRALEQTISLIESSNTLDLNSQSGLLYANYIRLYVLDERMGDENGTEVALIKAKYWQVIHMETLKLPDSEINQMLSVDTPDQITKWVNTLDAGDDGRKPEYLKFINAHSREEKTNSESLNRAGEVQPR